MLNVAEIRRKICAIQPSEKLSIRKSTSDLDQDGSSTIQGQRIQCQFAHFGIFEKKETWSEFCFVIYLCYFCLVRWRNLFFS